MAKSTTCIVVHSINQNNYFLLFKITFIITFKLLLLLFLSIFLLLDFFKLQSNCCLVCHAYVRRTVPVIVTRENSTTLCFVGVHT